MRGSLKYIAATLVATALAAAAAPSFARPASDTACAAADRCTVLAALTIDGVSVYPLRELAPLYADYLTRPVSQADLARIAQSITEKYRADGYFLSRAVAPPEEPSRGQARLGVYEGYIAEVVVTGEAAAAVSPLLRGLAGQGPVKLAELERRLTLANDVPGAIVRAALEPLPNDPAAHRLVVSAELRRWTAGLYVDNRGTKALGPDQAYVQAGINSVFRPGDQFLVSALMVPSDPEALTYGEVSYGAALASGARLRFGLSALRSRPAVSPLSQTLEAESQALQVRLAYPLVRRRDTSLWAALALDARHVEQAFTGGAEYADELRVVRASLQASRSAPSRTSNLSVQVSRGLGAFGASRSEGIHRSRFDADAQFWKINAGLSHFHELAKRTGLYLSIDGQWTPDAVLASEAFAPGGSAYGRAYNYAEISGDRGVAALAELRVGWDSNLPPLSFIQTYAFVDGSRVWNKSAALGARRAKVASAGGGLRLTLRDRVTLQIEAARPLGPAPWETGNHAWRSFASLWAGF